MKLGNRSALPTIQRFLDQPEMLVTFPACDARDDRIALETSLAFLRRAKALRASYDEMFMSAATSAIGVGIDTKQPLDGLADMVEELEPTVTAVQAERDQFDLVALPMVRKRSPQKRRLRCISLSSAAQKRCEELGGSFLPLLQGNLNVLIAMACDTGVTAGRVAQGIRDLTPHIVAAELVGVAKETKAKGLPTMDSLLHG